MMNRNGSESRYGRKALARRVNDLIFWATSIPGPALSLLLLFCSNLAYAGTFTLTYGKQFELCRAYQKNLDMFPDLTLWTTEWPLSPALKEFRKPRWRSVDARQNLAVIKSMYQWQKDPLGRLDAVTAEANWREEAPQVLKLIENNLVRLDIARVDFDADGKAERVYRYYHPLSSLDPQSRHGYWYIYFHDYSDDPYPGFRIVSNRLYDSFLFRGRFYLVGIETLGLTIQEPKASGSDLAIQDICIFSFKS